MKSSIGRVFAVISFLCLLVIGMFGCDFFPTQNKEGLPSDHSEKKTYAYHKAGMYVPLTSCADCHGQNLKGGISTTNNLATPSCYQCHTDIWGDIEHTLHLTGVDGSAYHKSGLYNPAANCSECHGQNLGGGSYNGSATPSCYKCHSDKWTGYLDHTLLQTGPDGSSYHKAGLYEPATNCTECHGQNLTGGIYNALPTPSCYKCHSSTWDWQSTHTLLKTGVDPQGYHVPTGINEPQTYCARCHGSNLRGGTFNGSPTKSCYQCHNSAVWDWRSTHTVRKDGKYHHPEYKSNPNMCQSCHGTNGQGGSARSCYGSGCHKGSWPPTDD